MTNASNKDTETQLSKVVRTEKIEASVDEIKYKVADIGTDQRNMPCDIAAESTERNIRNNNNNKSFARVVRESVKPSVVVKPREAGKN